MPKSQFVKGAENVWHSAGVRMRLTGSGDLQMQLNSLDSVRTFAMLPLAMQATTDIEPTRGANFKSQRIQFEFRITEIDEYFVIQKIVIFIKPVATSLPG